MSVRGLHQVSSHGVHQTLGLTGRAGGVNNEQRILGVVQFVGVSIRLVVHQVVVPDVAALSPRHSGVRHRVGGAGAVHHDNVLDVVLTGACFVGVDLHGNDLAAAVLAVGGDENLRAGVFHTELQRLGGETTEHERVNRTNTRAGEGEDNGFGDDGQVDDHAVTLAHAQGQRLLEAVRGVPGLSPGEALRLLLPELDACLVRFERGVRSGVQRVGERVGGGQSHYSPIGCWH